MLPTVGSRSLLVCVALLLAMGAGTACSSLEPSRCAYQIGWTRDVRGGLGGEVVRVTTLASRGPGSLREALATPEPRVVVFEVGGVIDLGGSDVEIVEPFVTVAGQTAPSPGITLIRGSLMILTHDVVVQHLAVRPGAAGMRRGWDPDGISVDGAHDVVVDHCSISWAVDENLSASGPRFAGDSPDEWRERTAHRITFSHNLVAEALSRSTHREGEHSKGTLIHDNVTDILVHANLYASNVDRNPMLKAGARGAVVNNLIVNPRDAAVSHWLAPREWIGRTPQVGWLSLVGNVLRLGADSPAGLPLLLVFGPVDLFREDNRVVSPDGEPLEARVLDLGGQVSVLDGPPRWPEGFTAGPSEAVVRDIRANVGARPWDRHPIDARILAEALAGSSRIIDSEDEVGGHPPVGPPSRAPFDPDGWGPCFEPLAAGRGGTGERSAR